MRPLPIVAGFLLAGTAMAQETPVLTVYAPDYFGSEWGPGPQIEALFEPRCGCDLRFVTGDVLSRLLLEGAATEADAIIGLNTDQTARARASGLFAPHGQDTSDLTMPVAWADEVFLPFNWGETAFVYNTGRLPDPPASFAALLAAPDDLKIVIQDPRSSASGLALLLWVKAVYGEGAAEAWARLKPKILTVTPGWAESYGLFTEGEADMVMSYTTSPAYHLIAEGDATKKAAIFPEGHYFMVELAAQLAGTDQPALAQDFMDFILSEPFQSMIATGNWSYPARLDPARLPAGFAGLPRPPKTLFFSETEAEALRAAALAEWLEVMSR
ncbi:thiamine ABC transporter substrate-binding protein [Frigidibacter oleivorans]|uniref:thiamine ABC transporter substrate-binding protein n=1 Tax=Frigidibacter oleivorans TaxID=2487129 RepID=UPI000F8CC782|nr:thiamine ABC transporter substrate binding subunit [Frigidibacter oleivorans]